MKMRKMRTMLMIGIMIAVLTGCTLPGFSTPTPFVFPTPDKTMTALFEPTQVVPATSASDGDPADPNGTESTATAKVVPTNTPKDSATDVVPDTKTPPPPAPTKTTISYAGPAIRSGPSLQVDQKAFSVTIDGDLSEWTAPNQDVIKSVVFGAVNWTDLMDCSGSVMAVWDADYLYFGVTVKDDTYVQEAEKARIYLGDSLEIVFDRYVSGDYYLQAMTGDDYQIGISPGRYGIDSCVLINGKVMAACSPEPPMAYMWAPKASAGVKTAIKIGAKETGSGYQVEFKVPWSLIGVSSPKSGDHYGFAISISDNDAVDKQLQQSMVSNVSTRFYANPTSWGDLYLK